MKFPIFAAVAALVCAAPVVSIARADMAMGAAGVVLDPKCLSESAWEVDATQAPIKVFGCRPIADIPAPNAAGWTVYNRPQVDGTDGGFTQVKMLAPVPPNKIVFLLVDNGGGSGNFGYKVTGVAGGDGVLQNPTVEIWNGGN